MGVYSYVVAVILAIIFYLADVDMGVYLICGFLVARCVQIVMNYFIIRNFWRASIVSILFLLGSVSLIASSSFFYWRSYFTRYRFVHIINSGIGR